MDYNHITSFLDKFKKIISQKEETKEVVVKTISEEISHPVEKNTIKIKDGCIYVKGSPILCSEIFVHKKQILTKLKDVLPGNVFSNIR
jgi:hypothetical protein